MKATSLKMWAMLLAVGMVVVACSSGSGTTSSDGTSGDDGDGENKTEVGEDAIPVGAIYPLTGSSGPAGEQALHGVELAAEIVNGEYPEIKLPLAAEKGLPNIEGRQIQIEASDHAGKPENGSGETKRLISDKEVVAMLGAYNSAVTTTASEEAERQGIPFVNGASSSTALTTRGLETFRRVGPSDKDFISTYFEFITDLESENNTTFENIAILNENTEFGTDAAEVARELVEGRGYNIVSEVSHGNEVADVTPEARKIIDAEPDIIFQASYTPEAILFNKVWQDNDYAAPVMAFGAGFSDETYYESVGDQGNYAITRAAWSVDAVSDSEGALAVAKLYEETYDTPMDENSARTFQAAMTLFIAMNEAGSTDSEEILSALDGLDLPAEETIMPWKGVKFDQFGQNENARGVITQRIEGKFEVVWTASGITDAIVWPVPKPSER